MFNTTWVCVPRWSASAGRCCDSWGACGTAEESVGGSFEESCRGTSSGTHRVIQTLTAVSTWWAECCCVGRNQPPQSFPTVSHSWCRLKVKRYLVSYANLLCSPRSPDRYSKSSISKQQHSSKRFMKYLSSLSCNDAPHTKTHLWESLNSSDPLFLDGLRILLPFTTELCASTVDGHGHECRSEPSPQQ